MSLPSKTTMAAGVAAILVGIASACARTESVKAERATGTDPITREYEALRQMAAADPGKNAEAYTPRAGRIPRTAAEWFELRNMELHDRGLAFYREHPNDPRRWDVLVTLRYSPTFYHEVMVDGRSRREYDAVQAKAWSREFRGLMAAAVSAPDASAAAKEQALSFLFQSMASNWNRIRTEENEAEALARLQGWFALTRRDYGRSAALHEGVNAMADILEISDPAEGKRLFTRLLAEDPSNSPMEPELRSLVEQRLQRFSRDASPLLSRLDDLDGEFRRKRSRGESAFLLALYPVTYSAANRQLARIHERYHARGLEIVHVTDTEGSNPSAPRISVAEAVDLGRAQPWRVVVDRDGTFFAAASALGYNHYPTWLLVGADGRVLAQEISGQDNDIRPAIERELGAKQ